MPETRPTTEGQRQLRALVTPPITAAELARRLDVTGAAVSLWIKGEARPTRERAAEIEAITGIPAATWGEAPTAEKTKARKERR